MRIIRHVSESVFQENTYILEKKNQVIIIDPGDVLESIISHISFDSKVLAVLATHAHLDHITSAKELCKKYNCPFILSSADKAVLDAHEQSCEYFRQPYLGTPIINIDILSKNDISLGDFTVQILHTPGHTLGGVCYLIDNILFSGDTLFHRSIGRTDLPGGDQSQLLNSIKKILFKLPDETKVYPGHMDATSIGEEKKFNPYVNLLEGSSYG